jgi:hypothetical protein
MQRACRSFTFGRAPLAFSFATPDGIDALRATASASKISCLVLGAATFKAFEALTT